MSQAAIAGKQRISMKDIAREAGVSATVVSSALSGSGRVGEAKKQEIIQLARKMGYRRNSAARLLKSKRIADLGLLIFEKEELIRENAAFMDMTIQFQKECLRNNIHFQLEWFDCYKNKEEVPQILTNGLVGGVLIAGVPANAAGEYIRKSIDMPYVTLGEESDYSVCIDHSEQLRQAIYYLVSMGHADIGLINGPLELSVFRNCRKIFDETLKELSLSNNPYYGEFCSATNVFEQTENLLKHYVESETRPTAMLILSGLFCKSFISGLFKYGVRVPEDLSLICFETVDWEAEKFYPPITAVENRFDDMIVSGVKMLCDLIDGKSIENPHQKIYPRFTKRETVASIR